jgi:hypothetical protein
MFTHPWLHQPIILLQAGVESPPDGSAGGKDLHETPRRTPSGLRTRSGGATPRPWSADRRRAALRRGLPAAGVLVAVAVGLIAALSLRAVLHVRRNVFDVD